MYVGVKAVRAMPDFQLLITFENGEQRFFDVQPYLDEGVFRELRDIPLFNSVRVNFDTVEWPNGADLCPETLYTDSVPAETPNSAMAAP